MASSGTAWASRALREQGATPAYVPWRDSQRVMHPKALATQALASARLREGARKPRAGSAQARVVTARLGPPRRDGDDERSMVGGRGEGKVGASHSKPSRVRHPGPGSEAMHGRGGGGQRASPSRKQRGDALGCQVVCGGARTRAARAPVRVASAVVLQPDFGGEAHSFVARAMVGQSSPHCCGGAGLNFSGLRRSRHTPHRERAPPHLTGLWSSRLHRRPDAAHSPMCAESGARTTSERRPSSDRAAPHWRPIGSQQRRPSFPPSAPAPHLRGV